MVYQVQVATDPQFQNLIVNKIVPVITEYKVTDDLVYFTVYYWRVKSIDDMTGAESDWSIPCMFRVVAEDVTITTNVCGSYTLYGSNCFGLHHKFITSYDTECITPPAIIGAGLCHTSATALIGATICGDRILKYCPGVCIPVWDGYTIEYLLTEDNFIIQTEDGIPLLLEY
jgi:hypothetical protein